MPVVPDLTDLHPSEAFDALHRAGLQPVLIGVPTVKSDGNTGYRVAAQEPGPGAEIAAGTRVALALAPHLLSFGHGLDGPPVAASGAAAPNVVGLELEDAMERVTRDGLIAVVFQPERGVEHLTISRQEPAPGAPVEAFREVALWLD